MTAVMPEPLEDWLAESIYTLSRSTRPLVAFDLIETSMEWDDTITALHLTREAAEWLHRALGQALGAVAAGLEPPFIE